MIDLSICLLTFNTKDLLRNCLSQIKKASKDLSVEILLVDNGSTDGASQMVEKEFPEVKLITSPKNLLYIKGHNLNLRRAKGKYFLILNEDIIFPPDTFTKMFDFMEKNPKVGLVSIRQVDQQGKLDITCSKFPHPLYDLFEATYLGKLIRKTIKFKMLEEKLKSYHLASWKRNTTRQVDVLPGSFLIGRSDLLKKIGYLDENLLFFYGEPDYCQRAKAASFEIVHNGELTIKHLRGKGLAKLDPKKRNALVEHDMLTYYRKYFSGLWQPIIWIFLKSNWLAWNLK